MVGKVSRESAVILCSHVAFGAPVLSAMRTEPEDEFDSGWQIICNCHEENWADAKVCSLSEALELAPSLKYFIDLPYDVTIVRGSESSEWSRI